MPIGRTMLTTKQQVLVSTLKASFNARYGRKNTPGKNPNAPEGRWRSNGCVRREWAPSTSSVGLLGGYIIDSLSIPSLRPPDGGGRRIKSNTYHACTRKKSNEDEGERPHSTYPATPFPVRGSNADNAREEDVSHVLQHHFR